jgi:membrane protein
MTFADMRGLVKDSVAAWSADYAASMGAALSYYTIFSIAPLLVIVIAIAGLAFGEAAAKGAIFEQLRGMVGDSGAAAVQGLVGSASAPAASVFAALTGLVTMLLGATTVLGELQSDLDRIWRAPPVAQGGFWQLLRTRALSFSMILVLGFLLLVSLVLSAAIVALGQWWGPWFGRMRWLLEAMNLTVSFLVVTALFAMIYKILPRVRIGWRDVAIGAGVTALLLRTTEDKMKNIARRAAAATVAAATLIPAIAFAEDPFGPIHMAANRHEYRGRGCPIEVLYTGTINFVPHHHGFSMNYSFDRSDGARGPVHVVHVKPGERSLVVRERWRLGGRGERLDAAVTLHVNSGNTHLRESSPTVHIDCL